MLNNTLKNDNDGLVFKFKISFLNGPLLGFHLVSDTHLKKKDQPKTSDKLEQFLLTKNLKASGKMVTIHKTAINLWDFD